MFQNKDEIIHTLEGVRDFLKNSGRLKEPIYFVIVGSATLMLRHRLHRASYDVDVFLRGDVTFSLYELMPRFGVHLVSEGFLPLHPDFEERLSYVPECSDEMVHFLMLSDIDIVISKLGRGAEDDIQDILNSGVLDKIDLAELKKLFFEATQYWIGDPRKYEITWRLFEDEYVERNRTQAEDEHKDDQRPAQASAFDPGSPQG